MESTADARLSWCFCCEKCICRFLQKSTGNHTLPFPNQCTHCRSNTLHKRHGRESERTVTMQTNCLRGPVQLRSRIFLTRDAFARCSSAALLRLSSLYQRFPPATPLFYILFFYCCTISENFILCHDITIMLIMPGLSFQEEVKTYKIYSHYCARSLWESSYNF